MINQLQVLLAWYTEASAILTNYMVKNKYLMSQTKHEAGRICDSLQQSRKDQEAYYGIQLAASPGLLGVSIKHLSLVIFFRWHSHIAPPEFCKDTETI